MANAYQGLTIELNGKSTGLSKALSDARKSASGVSKELKMIDKALKLDPGNVKLLAQQQEGYRKKIKATQDELEALRETEKQLGKDGMDSEQWTKLQSDIALAEKRLEGWQTSLAKSIVKQEAAESTLGKLANKFDDIQPKLQKAGDSMQAVGHTLTSTVTTGLAVAGAASVVAATEIDSSLTSVKKTVEGTEEQYQALKEAAIEFSQTNAVSASQILDIQALGAQLGFAIDELDEFAEVVSGLSIATNMDAETAATEMAQFANITKMAHDDIDNYGSAIVGLGNSFATTESDISAMAMRLAASGTQVGLSQADILGLATALSSMGVEAEAGGTAISTIMAQIDKDIALNAESVETWANTAGMSAQQFADAWKSNPVEALTALLSNMEAATAEGGNMSVMLDELGIDSVRQLDIMKRLAGNSSVVTDAVAKANSAWEENIALQREVDNRNESLAAKFEIIKNRIVAIAEDVGGPLADALLDSVDAAEPLIQALADGAQSFADMDEESQRMLLSVGALAMAFGPVTTGAGKLMSASDKVGSALHSMADKMADLKSSSRLASDGLGKLTAATKLQATAMTASKAAVGAFVTLALLALVTAAMKAHEQQEKLTKATDGLADSSRDASSTMGKGTAAVDAYSESVSNATLSVKDLIDKQAQLVDTMNERNAQAGGEIATLEAYAQTIEDLAGRADLSTEDVAKLQVALDKVNESCGTSYTIAQDTDGAYRVMGDGAEVATDAINKLVEAQLAQIQLDALSQNYADVMAQKEQAAVTLAQAQADYNKTVEEYNAARDAGLRLDGYWQTALEQSETSLNNAQAAYDACVEGAANLTDQMTVTQMIIDGTASSFDVFVNNSAALRAGIDQAGQSTETFRTQLAETGVSIEDLAVLNDEQLANIGLSYDGTTASIIEALKRFGIDAPNEAAAAAEGVTETMETEAEKTSSGYAKGIGSAVGKVAEKATELADAAKKMNRDKDESYTWGEHLGGNFASGIGSVVSSVSSAATTLADKVKNVLGHTIPKEGPLRNNGKGEKEWGEHTVQNYVAGINAAMPELQRAMTGVSSTVASGFAQNMTVSATAAQNAVAAQRATNGPMLQQQSLSKADMYEVMAAAMEDAFAAQGDVVLKIGNREFGRAVRKVR